MKQKTMTAEPPAATLPAGTPLLAKVETMSELFGISAPTLYRLRVQHPDFARLTIKTGRAVLYDVPRCYEWFSKYLGGELGT